MIHLLLRGNSYSQIIRDGMGGVVGLYPLLPNRMSIDRGKEKKLRRLQESEEKCRT